MNDMVTVIMSNYNYSQYMSEAIESVLAQTYPHVHIIIVDDGSTDASRTVIQGYIAGYPGKITSILKDNGGQLSCLNKAASEILGDYVFLLDADDLYKPTYVAEALEYYRAHNDCDFLYCGYEYWGRAEGTHLHHEQDTSFGYTYYLTAFLRKYIGGIPTCTSMTTDLYRKIFPLDFEVREWKIRADDCMNWAASLALARKHYLAKPLVYYRIHEHNSFFTKKDDTLATFLWRVRVDRLFAYFRQRYLVDRKLTSNIVREFELSPQRDGAAFANYLKLIWLAEGLLVDKVRLSARLWRHHRRRPRNHA